MTEQAQIVRWEEPPPPSRGRGGRPVATYTSRYNAVADQLRANPGRWALLEEAQITRPGHTGLATKIAMGHLLCFTPAGDFEAVARRRAGKVRTYARYLGNGDES